MSALRGLVVFATCSLAVACTSLAGLPEVPVPFDAGVVTNASGPEAGDDAMVDGSGPASDDTADIDATSAGDESEPCATSTCASDADAADVNEAGDAADAGVTSDAGPSACGNCAGSDAGTACLASASCGCNGPADCPAGSACNATTHRCSSSCAGGLVCAGACCDGATCQLSAATRCSGATPQSCNSAGTWVSGSVTSGTCGAVCTPAVTRCSGAVLQTCTSTGTWPTGAVTVGQCGAVCTPGTTGCSGTTPQTCSTTGTWTKGTVTSGDCGAVCTPAATRCSGAVPQTCSASGAWTSGAVVSGTCGAVCTPGGLECDMGDYVGQLCSASGTWISNGSSDRCDCYAAGRFMVAGTNLVLDTTTGLTWDGPIRPAATWATASTTCNSAGMRLPSAGELQAVLVTYVAADCTISALPLDESAMPTTPTDLLETGSTTSYALWSGTLETGDGPQEVDILRFQQLGGGTDWITNGTDDSTTASYPYRCVK
jgi:hypothetical protein